MRGRAQHRGSYKWQKPAFCVRRERRATPSVPIVGLEMGLARVALLALVAYRGGDGRNPDLAVPVVEICCIAARSLASAPLLSHSSS